MDPKELLTAICSQPNDESLRLAYADCLEKEGESDRAEFIRIEIRLANPDLGDEEIVRLSLRRDELRSIDAPKWLAELPRIDGVSWTAPHGIQFARGFPCFAKIEKSLSPASATQVFSATPITRLVLHKQSPADVRWLAEEPGMSGIEELTLRSFDSIEDHFLALSQRASQLPISMLRVFGTFALDEAGVRGLVQSSIPSTLATLEVSGHNFGWEEFELLDALDDWEGPGRLASLKAFAFSGYSLPAATGMGTHGLSYLAYSSAARLKRLQLNEDGLDLDGIRIIANSPSFSELRELNLARNLIGDRCAEELAHSPVLSSECTINVRESRAALSARGLEQLRNRFRDVVFEGLEPELDHENG